MKFVKVNGTIPVFFCSIMLLYASNSFAKKAEVVDMSNYFEYDTAILKDGYVVGWLRMPQFSNAVLICSDERHWHVRSFLPKASENRHLCNYHYINPDFVERQAPKGLYFWLDQVTNSNVIISNSKKGTLLKPQFRMVYPEVGSFYATKVLMQFPETLYFYSAGNYFLYEPQKKKRGMKRWDENGIGLHPFSIEEAKKGLRPVSSEARNRLRDRMKTVTLVVHKD